MIMRLLCINTGPLTNSVGIRIAASMLEEGAIYTLLGENCDKTGYYLVEVQTLPQFDGFIKARFVPLSDASEEDIVEETLEMVEMD